ncbi:hypothetical protein CO845_19290, partial [Vibrio cholerae]|nr:hypothetical protein [Vibrio cholerae]
ATYSNMTSTDISNSVTWAPAHTNTATVSPSGLLSGVEVGSTTLTATKDGVTSNTVSVTVSAAVITAIQVTPSPVNVAKGLTQQLVATATYSDGTSAPVTNSVTWTPVDTTTATVSPAGVLSGRFEGSTTLTATKDGVTSNTVSVTVSAAVITAIEVRPKRLDIVKGKFQLLSAYARLSDGRREDISGSVTWVMADTSIATVSRSRHVPDWVMINTAASAIRPGKTTLTVAKDGITKMVDVNVCEDLAGPCIDVYYVVKRNRINASYRYFSAYISSPSKVYVDTVLGTSPAPAGIQYEDGTQGALGDYNKYNMLIGNSNALDLCKKLAEIGFSYRDNDQYRPLIFRLPKVADLNELYSKLGNMYLSRGWPTSDYYWTEDKDTSNADNHFDVNLSNGVANSNTNTDSSYVSCYTDETNFQ